MVYAFSFMNFKDIHHMVGHLSNYAIYRTPLKLTHKKTSLIFWKLLCNNLFWGSALKNYCFFSTFSSIYHSKWLFLDHNCVKHERGNIIFVLFGGYLLKHVLTSLEVFWNWTIWKIHCWYHSFWKTCKINPLLSPI